MKRQIIFLFALILIAVTTVFADDDPQTPFPVEEQCVVDVSPASDDWTYSGTLLMSGYAGIHAMQSDWDTPRVVASFYRDDVGEPLNGGQLSPDMNWYGVPLGRIEVERSLNRFWLNNGLRVYSLADDTVYQFRYEDYADEVDAQFFNCCAWDHETVQWIADDALVIGALLVHPTTEEVSLAPFFAGTNFHFETVFSPDIERVFNTGYTGIYDPYDSDKSVLSEIERVDGVAWQHNSEMLIVEHWIEGNDRNEADYLVLYDRDGNFIERVFDQNVGGINLDRPFSGRSELAWSLNDRYFAFNYYASYTTPPAQLYLLDLENKIAINTCLSPVSQPIWSPDAMQISMLLDSSDALKVVIFDVENWTLHEVARHSRERNRIGVENVLEPDMIGWRSNN